MRCPGARKDDETRPWIGFGTATALGAAPSATSGGLEAGLVFRTAQRWVVQYQRFGRVELLPTGKAQYLERSIRVIRADIAVFPDCELPRDRESSASRSPMISYH
jgi:hypothetical protein